MRAMREWFPESLGPSRFVASSVAESPRTARFGIAKRVESLCEPPLSARVSHFRHAIAAPADAVQRRYFALNALYISVACGSRLPRAYRPLTETWPSG